MSATGASESGVAIRRTSYSISGWVHRGGSSPCGWRGARSTADHPTIPSAFPLGRGAAPGASVTPTSRPIHRRADLVEPPGAFPGGDLPGSVALKGRPDVRSGGRPYTRDCHAPCIRLCAALGNGEAYWYFGSRFWRRRIGMSCFHVAYRPCGHGGRSALIRRCSRPRL